MNGGPGNHPQYNVHLPGISKQYQQPHAQQHQNHQAHHTQHDHTPHNSHTPNYGNHQHNLSGGLNSQYQHNQGQNGTAQGAHIAMSNAPNEHWRQQLQLYSQASEARAPHHYARLGAQAKNNVLLSITNGVRKEDDKIERHRMTNTTDVSRQEWASIDLGGQGLKAISTALFDYTFLDKLFFNFNKLTMLPPSIGQLRNLTHLDLSFNGISQLPPEIGMLMNLRTFLLFENPLTTLPYEMGTLHKLEMLGIEGCPLEEELKSIIVEHGTGELITYLRDRYPGMPTISNLNVFTCD
jgi:CCR4-NOT transcription complex subunit 6